MALGYVKSFNFVDKILIGVDSIYQLKRNLNQFKLNLPNNIKNKIDLIKIKDINFVKPINVVNAIIIIKLELVVRGSIQNSQKDSE